tara:strand:- start:160 stop:327 length:168 start_codon:yes stop_codon:yes gene_type:complete
MKTALTELIEWMEGRAITHESVRQKATELLEKEKTYEELEKKELSQLVRGLTAMI